MFCGSPILGLPKKKIRVMYPNAASYVDENIDQVYIAHEKEKKRAYHQLVIQMEKGTITPQGVLAVNEADRHHKQIAFLIAEKRRESYVDDRNYIRTRIEERFNCN